MMPFTLAVDLDRKTGVRDIRTAGWGAWPPWPGSLPASNRSHGVAYEFR